MSKRVCAIHGIWDKKSSKDRCPKCKKSRQKVYDTHIRDKTSTKFYRTRQWQEIRVMVLRSEPLCRKCRVALSSHVDHVIPMKAGGCKLCRDNLQALCNSCHTKKTNIEHVLNRPFWLPTPNIPVIIIAGPSGSGKSFVANNISDDKVLVIDLDTIRSRILGKSIYSWDDEEGLTESILERNRILTYLSSPNIKSEYESAILIISAPKKETREWWGDILNAKTVLFYEDVEYCKDMVSKDSRRSNRKEYFFKVIDDWFSEYTESENDYIYSHHGGDSKSLEKLILMTKPPTKSLDKPYHGGTL